MPGVGRYVCVWVGMSGVGGYVRYVLLVWVCEVCAGMCALIMLCGGVGGYVCMWVGMPRYVRIRLCKVP